MEKPKQRIEDLVIQGLLLLLVLLLFYFLFLFFSENPKFLENIARTYGLLGIFIGSMVANATIVFPIPFDAVIFFVGSNPAFIGLSGGLFFDLLALAVIAGLGAAIGEMTSYLAGLTGVKAIEGFSNKQLVQLEQIRVRLKKHGVPLIVGMTLLPFPFDLLGLAAGIIRFDFRKFFLGAFIGKSLRYFIVAYSGNVGFGFVTGLLH